MKSYKKAVMAMFCGLGVLFLASPAFARVQVMIDPAMSQGVLVVTTPQGEVKMFFADQGVNPDVESGSTVEVLDGAFHFKTEEGDSISMGWIGKESRAANGAAGTVTCSETECVIRVTSGYVTYFEDGVEKTLRENETLKVTDGAREGEVARPTAATETSQAGFSGEALAFSFDSRNIEQTRLQNSQASGSNPDGSASPGTTI